MVTTRGHRWRGVLIVSFVIAALQCLIWFFNLAAIGWLYVATIDLLTVFERMGLPTLGSSIEGWPLPSALGWIILFIISWAVYAAIFAIADSMRNREATQTI
jgi:hypothetical protein